MAEEIQEAVQIIRVAYDGIEIAMKVGSGGIAAMQKAIDFLKGMLDYEKSLGKTSMRKLLLKGGDLQVLQFKIRSISGHCLSQHSSWRCAVRWEKRCTSIFITIWSGLVSSRS